MLVEWYLDDGACLALAILQSVSRLFRNKLRKENALRVNDNIRSLLPQNLVVLIVTNV